MDKYSEITKKLKRGERRDGGKRREKGQEKGWRERTTEADLWR